MKLGQLMQNLFSWSVCNLCNLTLRPISRLQNSQFFRHNTLLRVWSLHSRHMNTHSQCNRITPTHILYAFSLSHLSQDPEYSSRWDEQHLDVFSTFSSPQAPADCYGVLCVNGVDDDEDSDDDADADDDDDDGDVTWRRSFLSLSLADSFKVFTATVLVPFTPSIFSASHFHTW